jgi:hypothetical protein
VTEQARRLAARHEVLAAVHPRLVGLETAVGQRPRPGSDERANPDQRGDAGNDEYKQKQADPLQFCEHERRIVAQSASFTAA